MTIHCIGRSLTTSGEETSKLFYAMSRLEVHQMAHKAAKEGLRLEWYAQTAKGRQILGPGYCEKPIPTPVVPGNVDTQICPICSDKGCPVCNYSGICTPGNENKWMGWQIEAMRKEYGSENS